MVAGDDDCEWRLVNAAASIKLELTVTLAWHNLCFRPEEDVVVFLGGIGILELRLCYKDRKEGEDVFFV